MAGAAVTIPDTVIAAVTAGLPGASLWDGNPIDVDQLVVFDGQVPPTPSLRYAVVYIDPGTLRALAVCGQSDDVTVRWQITSVAPDAQRARWISATSRDAIVDHRPTVGGWACGLIRHTYSQMPQRDEAVPERRSVYQVDLYELLATRM